VTETPFPEPDPATGALRVRDDLVLLPTLHQTLEFAVLVRRAFCALRPAAVALELPRTIEDAFRRAVLRQPVLSVILYPDAGETVYLLVEPHEPMVEAARLALENGVPLFLVDRDDGSYPLHRERALDPYALTRTGTGPYVKALLDRYPPSDEPADLLRDRTMAYRLKGLTEAGGPVLWVGGAAHVRGILRALDHTLAEPLGRVAREGVRLAALTPESSREVMSEIPFVAAAFEKARSEGRAFDFDDETDAPRVLDALLKEAATRYAKEQRQEVSRRAFEILRQFSRNLCLLQGALVPGFYELVVTARAAVDEDFAWHVFDAGATWPWQDTSHALPEVHLTGEDLLLDGRPVRFRRRFPNKGARLRRLPVKRRPREKRPGDWRRTRFGGGICSYPPEDIVIEGFGDRLRRRAADLLSSETRRVVPMTTSLLDGVDIKETLRRLHEGRLFVFEEHRLRGGIGSVVVIFDEDDTAYPWKTTWLGEHGQESDMAFYATPAGETLDGPGISRCQYGGFVMTTPPGRLADVFSDPDYQGAESAKEVLLLAALDYALEPRVVYAARTPPRTLFKRWAARLGKRIVYLPLGALAPAMARRLRTFHVLANRAVRLYAKDYIGH
jgi:hypothetical protein